VYHTLLLKIQLWRANVLFVFLSTVIVLPMLGSLSNIKSRLACSLHDREKHTTINDCVLCLDSSNTACDLLMNYDAAIKLSLTASLNKKKVDDAGSVTHIVQMVPSLYVAYTAKSDATAASPHTCAVPVNCWVRASELRQSGRGVFNMFNTRAAVVLPLCSLPGKVEPEVMASLGASGIRKLMLDAEREDREIVLLEDGACNGKLEVDGG